MGTTSPKMPSLAINASHSVASRPIVEAHRFNSESFTFGLFGQKRFRLERPDTQACEDEAGGVRLLHPERSASSIEDRRKSKRIEACSASKGRTGKTLLGATVASRSNRAALQSGNR
jgi:hypothetical protein